MPTDTKIRCRWAVENPDLIEYHDNVWSVRPTTERRYFEALGLCILHAGLGWIMVLRKRDQLAAAFEGWDPATVARYDGNDMERLMEAPGMIRNFQKVNSIIYDAERFLEIQREFGSFGDYLWRFTDGQTLVCDDPETGECTGGRREAERLSQDLKQRGFKFAGPGTAFGLMEDVGLLNHHDKNCFKFRALNP